MPVLMGTDKIGDWNVTKLSKWMTDWFKQHPLPTSDATKAAINNAVAGAAPLVSPAFTGVPTAPTPSPGDNTNALATTAFVEAAVGTPPGTALAYNTQTGFVNLATTDTTVIGGSVKTYDGSQVIIEFYGIVVTPSVAGSTVSIVLYDGATQVVIPAVIKTPAAANLEMPVFFRVILTPSAGSHQYAIKAHASTTTGTPQLGGGTGTVSTGFPPAYLRVTQA